MQKIKVLIFVALFVVCFSTELKAKNETEDNDEKIVGG